MKGLTQVPFTREHLFDHAVVNMINLIFLVFVSIRVARSYLNKDIELIYFAQIAVNLKYLSTVLGVAIKFPDEQQVNVQAVFNFYVTLISFLNVYVTQLCLQ